MEKTTKRQSMTFLQQDDSELLDYLPTGKQIKEAKGSSCVGSVYKKDVLHCRGPPLVAAKDQRYVLHVFGNCLWSVG